MPALAVLVAFVLSLIGMGFLIYFIHHIASSIQASNLIHGITAETMDVIETMFPDKLPIDADEEPHEAAANSSENDLAHQEWHPVPALSFGYIQRVEKDALLKLTCQECLTLRMEVGVGEFARRGRPLASVCNCGKPSEKLVKRINAEYAIDAYRTIEQDPGFGIQQLVDIAVKALSPGVNDTTTAATAVDYLSEVLCELATRRLESAHFFSGSELKIIVRGFTFQKLLHDAFEQIVENAHGNQAVMTHLLKSLKEIGPVVPNGCRRQALVEQLGVIAELAQHTLKSTLARERVEARIAEVRSLLIINAPS